MRITPLNCNYNKQSFGISEGVFESVEIKQARLKAEKIANQNAKLTKVFEHQSNETTSVGDVMVRALTAKNANEALAKLIKL